MKNLLILVCALAAVRAAKLPQNYVPPGQGSGDSSFGGAQDFGVSRDSGFASQSLSSSSSGGVPLPAVSNLDFSASPRQSYSAPAANQGFTGASNSIVSASPASQSLSQPSQSYSAPSSQSLPAPQPPRQSYSAPSSQSLPPPPPPRQSYSAPSGQSPPPPPPRQSYSAPSGQSLPSQPPSQAYSAPSGQSLPPPPPPGQSYSAPSGQGLSEFARQSDFSSQNQVFSEPSVQSFPVTTSIQVSQSVDDQSFARSNGQIFPAVPDQSYSLPAQTAGGRNDQSFTGLSNSLSQSQPAQSHSTSNDQSFSSVPDTLYRTPNGPAISGSSGQKFSSLSVSDDSHQSAPVDPSFLRSNGQSASGSSRQSYSRSNDQSFPGSSGQFASGVTGQSFTGSSGQFASGVTGQSFTGSSGQFASGVTGQSFSGTGQSFTQSAGQSFSGSFDQSFSSASNSRNPGRDYSPPRQDTPASSTVGNAGQGFSSQGVSQNAGYGSQSADCPEGQVRHVNGQCVVPEIKRHVFVYAAPEQETKYSAPPPNVPLPKVEHNIVFIRTPDQGEGQEPIIVPPPQQKSIIYVLNKGSENQGPRIIEVPTPEKKEPEVYFVNYADGENPTLPDGIDFETALNSAIQAEGQVLGNAEGTSLASANLNNNFEGDNNFISSQDSDVSFVSNVDLNRGTGNGNTEYSNIGNTGGSSGSTGFDASFASSSSGVDNSHGDGAPYDVRAGGSNNFADNAVFVGGNDIGARGSSATGQGFDSFSSGSASNFNAGSATGVALPVTLYSTP